MCRYLETIKLKDGEFFRLNLHQQRIEKTISLNYQGAGFFDLTDFLHQQDIPDSGLFKCRLVYDNQNRSVEFLPYYIRPINSLKLVEADIPASLFKTEDRQLYNAAFAQRGEADDVLIVRNAMLTDSSYCNVALFNGREWLTPSLPLLYGTQRQFLISQQIIQEADISVDSISEFQSICLFNAMIEFGELELPVESIIQ